MNPVLARTYVLVALTVLSASCSGSGSRGLPPRELDSVLSWIATARMVLEEWLEGSVPAAFTRRTLGRAGEELSREAERLRGRTGGQAAVAEELTRLRRRIDAARGDLEAPEGDAITRALDELRTTGPRLRTLGERTR